MDKTFQESPQGRVLPTIVIFVFILGVLYALFLLFQQFSLNSAITDIGDQKMDIEKKISVLQSQQIEELYVAQSLKERLDLVTIEWSKVIRKLQDLTPVTVFFTSYSGGEDGEIQISGLGDSYGSVADTIAALEKSSDFEDPFVPSTTLGTTSDGQSVVSFSLQVNSALDE